MLRASQLLKVKHTAMIFELPSPEELRHVAATNAFPTRVEIISWPILAGAATSHPRPLLVLDALWLIRPVYLKIMLRPAAETILIEYTRYRRSILSFESFLDHETCKKMYNTDRVLTKKMF